MLGVNDYMRMGGLRLSHSHSPGVFLAEHTNIPKLIHMRQLETAARNFESGIETVADLAQKAGIEITVFKVLNAKSDSPVLLVNFD